MRRRSTAATGGQVPEKTWRQRLAHLRSYPSTKSVAQFVEKVINPALTAVAEEFKQLRYDVELTHSPNAATGITDHTLIVKMASYRNFQYRVAAVEAPVPVFGGRSVQREIDVYYRLEVFTQTGSEGYDLMGLSPEQVINDVLDRYEAHLSFLQYSTDRAYPTVITPPAAGTVPHHRREHDDGPVTES
ncbi:hypothetical protein NHF46_09275 [Arthrobacter alpinus]|nr:hypothetical protein [Arthrobacter alpinus]